MNRIIVSEKEVSGEVEKPKTSAKELKEKFIQHTENLLNVAKNRPFDPALAAEIRQNVQAIMSFEHFGC